MNKPEIPQAERLSHGERIIELAKTIIHYTVGSFAWSLPTYHTLDRSGMTERQQGREAIAALETMVNDSVERARYRDS